MGKKIMKVIIIIIAIVIIALIVCYSNQRIKLSKEAKLFTPLGQLVEVNGHKMSVYTEGNGEIPLVFLSGGGTCSPILDFKSLYSILSDDYKIVVVEKFGYGFSDIIDEERDINTILSETREALKQAKIEGPYVLCPHSVSGITSLYWAQQYPDEVTAIIGLDMAVPEAYTEYKINMPMFKLVQFTSTFGITRLIPGAAESDAIKYGTLSEEEKDIYRTIFYRRTATRTMINEVKELKSNAKKVGDAGIPDTPMLMFSSNGVGTGWKEDRWRAFQNNYIKEVKTGNLIELDCSHYVHDIKYEQIADAIKTFLN
jgi:pimeloyl-ACP methyl ester carboxylesterase